MTCVRCDGSGEVCSECRLNEAECNCSGIPDLIECPVCDGEGETFGDDRTCEDCGEEFDEDGFCPCDDEDEDDEDSDGEEEPDFDDYA